MQKKRKPTGWNKPENRLILSKPMTDADIISMERSQRLRAIYLQNKRR